MKKIRTDAPKKFTSELLNKLVKRLPIDPIQEVFRLSFISLRQTTVEYKVKARNTRPREVSVVSVKKIFYVLKALNM